MIMKQDELKEFKTRLEKERGLLLHEINEAEKPVDFGSDIDHLEEKTDESEAMGNQFAVAHDLKARLTEIDDALLKIDSGKYGLCENCGKEIDIEILKIDPESRLCRSCKEA